MKGKAKRKVVTSGRLTGAAKANHVTFSPGAAAGVTSSTEPAYSLYSTDSEDQVTTLHKGLDRCAALLGGILQAEKAASPSLPRTVKGVGARSRVSPSLGKKTIMKLPTKTAPNRKSTTTSTARLGVKQPNTHLSGPSHGVSRTVPPPQTSVLLSVLQSSSHPPCHPDSRAERDREEDTVPVRDVKIQLPEAGPQEEEEEDLEDARNTEPRVKMVQYLLSELRTLITGQGSVAEKLLSHLEQTVSSPQTNIQTESMMEPSSLQSQNAQLRRRVKILNQQLKEREKVERQKNLEVLRASDALSLQEELLTAQSRLQELQDDIAGLRKSLQDTQNQLRDKEVENALLKTELEATRSRLTDIEREKSELASPAQKRPEEIGNPSRLPSIEDASPPQHRHNPPAPPADRVTQYLLSLGQPAAENTQSHPGTAIQPEGSPTCDGFNSTLSQCDMESLCSDWSMRSGSSINTRDEAAFRDGLAALDASIASLQKTIQLEMKR